MGRQVVEGLANASQGFWQRDHTAYREYAGRSRTAEGFRHWMQEWVLGVPDRSAYMARLDLEPIPR